MSGGLSLTTRLTLLFAAVSTTVLLALGLLIGTLVEHHFEALDRDQLTSALTQVQRFLAQVQSETELAALPLRLDDLLAGQHGIQVVILDAEGGRRYTYPMALPPPGPHSAHRHPVPAPGLESGLADRLPEGRLLRHSAPNGVELRVLVAAAPTGLPGNPVFSARVGLDLLHHTTFMTEFRLALWTTVCLAALASGFLGWLAARRGLAPLSAMRRSAAAITAERLDRRLPTAAIPPELAEVTETLNTMLARLETSFRRLSDFSSDIAHELRTPVSNLLTQTQVTLTQPRSVEQYQEVLASNAEEFERLSATIADMLLLAKADNALLVPQQTPVDLAAEVVSLFDYYEALAEEKGITLAHTGQGTVSGDRLMLRRALGNLLANALRHTPAGGRINVGIEIDAGGSVQVEVENTGETIAPEHLSRLFDRFYRADASRYHGGDGAGLGLAITRSLMEAHGGKVGVFSADGITRFTLHFPDTAQIPPTTTSV